MSGAPSTGIEAPFARYRGTVLPGYLDYNGHMNLAYYVLMFDQASDLLFDALGIGSAMIARAGRSVFAAETHTLYERELREGEDVSVRSTLLGVDAKRLHVGHEMLRAAGEAPRAAFQEVMFLSIDMATRRVGAWPVDIADRLAGAVAAHRALPRPSGMGRQIRGL